MIGRSIHSFSQISFQKWGRAFSKLLRILAEFGFNLLKRPSESLDAAMKRLYTQGVGKEDTGRLNWEPGRGQVSRWENRLCG
jgi:hypothetical protein